MIIKFTNIKMLIGGGKSPQRFRSGQNYSLNIYLKRDIHLLNLSDLELIQILPQITSGRIIPTSSTKVKRVKKKEFNWKVEQLKRVRIQKIQKINS
jgi:hypothetical protein